ncbi:hypothetical protein NQZ68_038517 [Dissostichus eleginoides]|nr:hypothetical protein NQZ68_038517 [Dissostichus eleginoides]
MQRRLDPSPRFRLHGSDWYARRIKVGQLEMCTGRTESRGAGQQRRSRWTTRCLAKLTAAAKKTGSNTEESTLLL